MIKKLIDLRNKLKAKMPTFVRHDAHKKKRLTKNWRKPKGRQNKMRLHLKGYARARSTGYGSPVLVKGLSREGLVQNLVHSVKDFTDLNNTKDGIILSRTTGVRKKLILIEYAEKNGFVILNLDPVKFKENYQKLLDDKKKSKETLNKRKKSQEESLKKSQEKKSKENPKETEIKVEDKKTKTVEEASNKEETKTELKKVEGDMK